jgi:predicted XRE-type DNA-binding protein
MNNIQELIKRLTDMCATEEGSPWPHDVMQCLIDCRSLLQAPLPEKMAKTIRRLRKHPVITMDKQNVTGDAADMLERLWRENEEYARRDIMLSDNNTELQQRIEELEGVGPTSIEAARGKIKTLYGECKRLNAALADAKKSFERIAEIRWGYDGNCGSNNIAECAIIDIEKARVEDKQMPNRIKVKIRKVDELKSSVIDSITGFIESNELSQQRVGEMIGATQGRVSNLINGRIDLFSLDNLVNISSKLGLIVSLQIKDNPKQGLRSYTGKPVK